ncbi:MAG: TonB-dependent receptor [Ferruginibacter sp.]|nr:TonB-dependent receptor [Ferruginibacter sp.]
MRLPKLPKAIIALISTILCLQAEAQVTTATISGTVTGTDGKALSAATVKISFPNAGINKLTTTQSDGTFLVPNLRVGGPYKVTVTYTGYQEKTEGEISLELGQNTSVDFKMETTSVSLEGVLVSAKSKIFDNQRTGASTNISSRQIRQLPTISRSADDYTRLTPSASATINGTSFAGRNGQYNNYSLDGAVFNNPFGLDAPTPGGQSGSQPVSLDAIDQIQVNIAPYDVTQAGFTGAGVNTVTKSGSNVFAGTAYGFYRNEGLTGKKVDGNKVVVPKLDHYQVGLALGGAIKKNKIYYFVSFETEQRSDAPTSYVAQNSSNAGKGNTSRVLQADLDSVRAILKRNYNYETGDYQGFNYKQKSYKWLAKLDWVINNNNSLSFTYNGLDASKEKPAHPSAISRRGPDFTTLQFRNSGYRINNKLQSFGTELKSSFGSKYANKLRLVYTRFRDSRDPFSAPFPVVNLFKNNVTYIVAGQEPFSINNILNQDAFQATNNFNIILPKHTLTVGASYESFKFANSFNLQGYGNGIFSNFNDISDFLTKVRTDQPFLLKPDFSGLEPISAAQSYAKNRAAAGVWTFYYLTVAQLSAYVQDEWKAGKNFRVTYGLRIDAPSYGNASYKTPNTNLDGTFKGNYTEGSPTVANNDNQVLFDENGNRISNGQGKQLDNTKFPTQKPLFSPRIGFNWDVTGDKTIQLRGGSGLFTGRFPFVWIGNQQANPFTGFYNATASNFRWPQIWRSNLGLDFKIPYGTVFSADIAYSKDQKAMMVRNYNLGTPTGTLSSGTGDNRKIYRPADKGTDGAFANQTYVFTNTDKGYQFNVSLQAQQSFKKGLYLQTSYNYLVSKDASSISAEISSDAFDRNPILNNANKAENSTSLYGNTHRFVLAGIKRFDYGKANAYGTTISFFSNWVSGDRFAYVYGGDINNDGTGSNDLLYVPTDAEISTMQFNSSYRDVNGVIQPAAAQQAALKSFIAQDDYLTSRRGKFTEKYAGETPWFGQLDVRILQDFNFTAGGKKSTVQFSIDIQNFGNMISSKWGVRKYATTAGFYQPLSVAVGTTGTPVFTFDPSQKNTFTTSPDLISRWQMQFGLRYIF